MLAAPSHRGGNLPLVPNRRERERERESASQARQPESLQREAHSPLSAGGVYGIHGSDRPALNRLLPTPLHRSRINLVVPGAHLPKKGYRPDLTLYFRGQKSPVPIEVKWASEGVPAHQRKYLQEHRGILIAMDGPTSQVPRLHSAQIDWPHFQECFGRSSLRLLRDAFNPQRPDGSEWVVVLRGDPPRINFQKMLSPVGKRGRPAESNHPSGARAPSHWF